MAQVRRVPAHSLGMRILELPAKTQYLAVTVGRHRLTMKRRYISILTQAPAAKRKKVAKGGSAGGGGSGTAASLMPQQRQKQKPRKQHKRDDGAAEIDQLAAADAEAAEGAAQRVTSAAAAATGNGAVTVKADKTAKRKRKEADVATVAVDPAAVQSSLEAAGLETLPVAQLRASEAATNGATDGEAPFRNKEKVLMLTSRGIPPRWGMHKPQHTMLTVA